MSRLACGIEGEFAGAVALLEAVERRAIGVEADAAHADDGVARLKPQLFCLPAAGRVDLERLLGVVVGDAVTLLDEPVQRLAAFEAFLVDGRRYYRECWIEWGQRRCSLKPRWWW